MRPWSALAGVVLSAACCLQAQAGADTAVVAAGGGPGLTILSSPDSALVAIDGVFRGTTPLVIDSLGAGRHRVYITGRDTANWLNDPVADTVELAQGEHRVFKYRLGHAFALSSVPSGATVLIGGIPAGITPMVLRVKEEAPVAPVTLRLAGYEPIEADLARAVRGALLVPLRRVWSAGQGEEEGEIVSPVLAGKPGAARLYISGLAAVAAGALAAYYKIQADNRNDTYLSTGDPSVRSQVHRFDTISALALTAAQIGMGLFAYFLLTE